jgi:hypothetical protein
LTPIDCNPTKNIHMNSNSQMTLFQGGENDSRLLCEAVQRLEKKCRGKRLTVINSPEYQEDLKLIIDYFGVSAGQALILVLFIYYKILNKRNLVINKITEWMDVDLHEVVNIIRDINKLCVMGILRKDRDDFESSEGFQLSQRAFKSVLTATPYKNESETIERNLISVIQEFYNSYEMFRSDMIDVESLFDMTEDLLENNNDIKEVMFIRDLDLSRDELLIFMVVIHATILKDNDGVNVERIIHRLFSVQKRISLIKSINKGDNMLMLKDLLTFETGWYKSVDSMTLTDKAIGHLLGEEYQKKEKTKLKRGTLISMDDYKPQHLFYNPSEEKEMDGFKKLLQQDGYDNIVRQLKEGGMNEGVTVLLFGKPGTGKTSTVMELASKTGRKIYKVEVETILGSYVGDSEKNLVEIFNEYHSLLEKEEKHPILLLNECDGLLKKRMPQSHTPVSEMMNTMVTLFLEKLENAKGIVFATMNEPNFDEAFDRRFLFKIKLNTPEHPTRVKILKNNFPELEDSIIENLSEKYRLTGAQINNIRKKFFIKNMLEPGLQLSECIIDLCEKEFVLSNSHDRPAIGFKSSQTQIFEVGANSLMEGIKLNGFSTKRDDVPGSKI